LPPSTCACTAASYNGYDDDNEDNNEDNDDDNDEGGGFAVDGHGGRFRGGSGPHPGEEGMCGGGLQQRP